MLEAKRGEEGVDRRPETKNFCAVKSMPCLGDFPNWFPVESQMSQMIFNYSGIVATLVSRCMSTVIWWCEFVYHSTKKPVTTMLTYHWKCTVLHCNHLGNTWKPLVLMTRHFDYCVRASEGDNQNVRSSAPVVSRCFPGGYNVNLYISRGRLAWLLLSFLQSVS